MLFPYIFRLNLILFVYVRVQLIWVMASKRKDYNEEKEHIVEL